MYQVCFFELPSKKYYFSQAVSKANGRNVKKLEKFRLKTFT